MTTYKYMGLIGLAAASLFATQAFATVCPTAPVGGATTQGSPVCIATTSTDTRTGGVDQSLQNQLDIMTTSGPNIDVYNGQQEPNSYWSIGATNRSENAIMLEIAGNRDTNTFGIFDPSNQDNYLQLFKGSAGPGWGTQLQQIGDTYKATYFNAAGDVQGQDSITIHGGLFGYYLGAASKSPTFFSDASMNAAGGDTYPHGMPNMVAYAGNGHTFLNGNAFLSGEYLLAWEDQPFAKSDLDYNDFVVLVESVRPDPVPEPAALGMFGLGLLLIAGVAGLSRRGRNIA